jgi:hypothetical protein
MRTFCLKIVRNNKIQFTTSNVSEYLLKNLVDDTSKCLMPYCSIMVFEVIAKDGVLLVGNDVEKILNNI